MRQLRILISTGIFPNRERGNRGIYNLKQAEALRRYCEVRVIAPVPYFPRFLPSSTYASYARIPRADRIGIFEVAYPRYFVTPRVLRSLHGFFLYLSVWRHYRRAIAEFRPDVILGFFAYPYGFANALLGATFGVPVVVSCRGSDINWIARSRIRGRLIAWSLRRCVRVFAVSGAMRDSIAALGVPADHVAVVPNGIEPERFPRDDPGPARERLGLEADRRWIVAVGRLSYEKGPDVLVRAFARLRDEDTRLALVGDGPMEEALRALADEMGVADRVHFAGDRPHDEVFAWITAADVFALPSRTEGWPNALVEALACGRPAVAARVGGVPEILTDESLGLMVEPEDPAALAAALEDALGRSWDRDHIAARGRARDWDAVARDMLDEFAGVLDVAAAAAPAGPGTGEVRS